MITPVKEGVKELVIQYFKTDIFANEPLTDENRQNIIETFTYCYNRHMPIVTVIHELKGSNLAEMRDRIIKRLGSNYNPFPFRLGELKPILQQRALAANKSLHEYAVGVLRKHVFEE